MIRLAQFAYLRILLSLVFVLGITFVLWFSAYLNPNEAPIPAQIKLFALCLLAPLLFKLVLQLYGLVGYNLTRQTYAKPIYPTISVIVPAYNEEVGITKTLDSIAASNYPHTQIIVVNDGSTDNTHNKITQWLKDSNTNSECLYINQDNGGKAKALNNALNQATGEIIVTVDADSVVAANTLFEIVQPFKDEQVGAVAGNIVVHASGNLLTWVQQLEYLVGFMIKRADSFFNSVYIIGGAAAAYRTSALQQVGHFDHRLITEDIELSVRMLSAGFKTKFASKAAVITEAPTKIGCLVKQRLRWKYGRIQTLYKHRSLFFSRNHNRYLSYVQLPMSLYAEFMLTMQWPLAFVLIGIAIWSQSFIHLALASVVLGAVILTLTLSDRNRGHHRNLLLLAPASWLVIPLIELAETLALAKTIKRFAFGQGVTWQSWSRKGINR